MAIKPELNGFRCANAHPEGCRQHVKQQLDYVKDQGTADGPKRVLVLGASNGLGLASRITAAFGYGASTVGVFFDRPGQAAQAGTPGWYNSAAFHRYAQEEQLYAKSINGDAFAEETKAQVVKLLREDLGQVDLVVYSLAAPKRTDTRSGITHRSALKPLDGDFSELNYNPNTGEVERVAVGAATAEEIAGTVAVMGGDDWADWIHELDRHALLSEKFLTTAFTYLGPQLTSGIYDRGTIGEAKRHLDQTALELRDYLAPRGGRACVSVLKAMVTTASAAIPMIPLYLAVLSKVLKEAGEQEGCIEQIQGLFSRCLYGDDGCVDEMGRYRMDLNELRPDTQNRVLEIWSQLNSDNLCELTDIDEYWQEYLNLFGFAFDNIDYSKAVDFRMNIEGLYD